MFSIFWASDVAFAGISSIYFFGENGAGFIVRSEIKSRFSNVLDTTIGMTGVDTGIEDVTLSLSSWEEECSPKAYRLMETINNRVPMMPNVMARGLNLFPFMLPMVCNEYSKVATFFQDK